jgi:hypothetical protein
MSWWNRVQEIEETAQEAGVTLPIPAVDIARMEEEGSMFDFQTGQFMDEPEEEPAAAEQKSWWR